MPVPVRQLRLGHCQCTGAAAGPPAAAPGRAQAGPRATTVLEVGLACQWPALPACGRRRRRATGSGSTAGVTALGLPLAVAGREAHDRVIWELKVLLQGVISFVSPQQSLQPNCQAQDPALQLRKQLFPSPHHWRRCPWDCLWDRPLQRPSVRVPAAYCSGAMGFRRSPPWARPQRTWGRATGPQACWRG